MTFATLSSKGQITVPASARQALGLHPGSRVLIETRGGQIIIHPPRPLLTLKGFLGKARTRQTETAAVEAEAAKRSRGVS